MVMSKPWFSWSCPPGLATIPGWAVVVFRRLAGQLHIAPVDRFPLFGQNLLNVGLALQIWPPTQVVGYQMIVATAIALDYNYAFSIRNLGYIFCVSGVTNFTGVA